MKRSAGGLVLLAILGGCMSNHDDPEMLNLISQRSGQLAIGEQAFAAPQPRRPAAEPPANTPQVVSREKLRPPSAPAPTAPAVPVAALASNTPAVLPEPSDSAPAAAPANPAPEPPDSDLALVSAPAPDPYTAAGQDPQNVIVVNSKRLMLDYEVRDAGPTGRAAVELWYTRNGQNWTRYGEIQNQPPFIVELEDEGLYGFTLRAHNAAGQGKPPPSPGDQPQALVEVDLTKPSVRLADILADTQAKTVTVLWEAADKNLAPRPIALSWARQAGGPWLSIISQLENSGRYVWQLPAGVPPHFLVRVEAVDTAGNVATAESPAAVGVAANPPSPEDRPQPEVAVRAAQRAGAEAPPPPPTPVEPEASQPAPRVQLRLEPAGS